MTILTADMVVDERRPALRRRDGRPHYAPAELYEAATAYVEAGVSLIPMAVSEVMIPDYSVIPFSLDGNGNKRKHCGIYRRRLPRADEIETWFRNENANSKRGLAVLTGAISGNLEAIEFDGLINWRIWQGQLKNDHAELLRRIVWARLPYGVVGFYRTTISSTSGKPLAYDVGKGHTPKIRLIGEADWCLVPPSPKGFEDMRREWRYLNDRDLTHVESVSEEERKLLMFCAGNLGRSPIFDDEDDDDEAPVQPSVKVRTTPLLPSEIIQERVTWEELLLRAGFQQLGFAPDGEEYWHHARLPSTVVINLPRIAIRVLGMPAEEDAYADAGPAVFKGTLLKFAAYAALFHGGNWKAAARNMADDFPQTSRYADYGD